MKLDTSTDPQVGYRPPGSLDATPLGRYAGQFGLRQAAHLLRRAGFGGTPDEIVALAQLGPDGAVDALVHPRDPEPQFTDYPSTDDLYGPKRFGATQLWWLDRMLRTRRPLVEKMTLFWHGHFATSVSKVPLQLMVGQIDLFRGLGTGRFPALLLAVSRDPAMLVWLDNRYNSKAHPNENYAREVMELFALGLGNYTEDDVKNAARAFTGWTLDPGLNFVERPTIHDDGVKTFLGRTGNFTGKDVIDIIVAQPISQRFIARKLLEYFVYSDPEPDLIEATASVYALSGFDIGRTVATILRSNVFFSARAYRALPKSPIEFAVGTLRTLGITSVPPSVPGFLARMGQIPLQPPSVKGWDGGPAWINTSTLLARFNFVNALVASAPATTPLVAGAIAQTSSSYDANRVLEMLTRAIVQDDVDAQTRLTFAAYLNGGSTTNPQPFGYENFQERIRGAIALTMNAPVNQLA